MDKICFGKCLAETRKARGLTQRDLAKKSGISHRMIAYYEKQDGNPPVNKLMRLAKALKVSLDELLGNKAPSVQTPQTKRLWKKLQQVENLPSEAQKQILGLIDFLKKTSGNNEN